MKKITVLHHFDKCGGTTLQEYLKNYHDENKICGISALDDTDYRFKTKSFSFKMKKIILNSTFIHDPFGVTLTLTDKQMERIAFFREPLPRLISHWHMISRLKDHEISHSSEHTDLRKIARSSFKEFLLAIKNQHPLIRNLNNFYANHLLYNNTILRKEYYESQQAVTTLEEYKKICAAALARFDFIGLIEDYDTSLLMLNELLNIPPVIQLQKLNVHNSSDLISSIDPETLSLAQELTCLDQYIYQLAVKAYDAQKSKFLCKMGNIEDARMLVQKKYENNVFKKRQIKKANITMTHALTGAGWHARERNKDKVSRWTGPSTRSYLAINLSRKKTLRFSLVISNYLSIQIIDDLKVFIDNEPVKIFKHRLPSGNIVVKGLIRKNTKNHLTKFIIDTGRTVKSTTEDDPRLLGIEITQLIINPLKKCFYD